MKKWILCVLGCVFLFSLGFVLGDSNCSCSGVGGGCSASCSPPTHAYCFCEPPPPICGCYIKPPLEPPKMSTSWNWLDVAILLKKEINLSGQPFQIKQLLHKIGLKPDLITVSEGLYRPDAPKTITIMELLRTVSQREGDVRIGGLPILAHPRLLDPASPTICLNMTSASPADLYVLIWSVYGEQWDFLLLPHIQNQEFALSINGVSLMDLENLIYKKFLDPGDTE